MLLLAAVAGLAFVGTAMLTRGRGTEESSVIEVRPMGPTSARPFPTSAGRAPPTNVAEGLDGGGPVRLEPLGLPDPGLPLDDLIDDFIDAATARYGDPLPLDLVPALAEQFLYEEAVQAHLRGLDPEERADTLADLRRRFGFPEAALARAAALDARRDEAWRNGLAYMERRRALAAESDGELSEAALDELRTHFFGRRASTIAREEARGFHRFERRRVIGRN